MIDYLKDWEWFQKLPLAEKIHISQDILQPFQWKWDTFDIIYQYFQRWENITEQDCIDVYQSLMKTSYEVESAKEIESLNQLKRLKEKWLLMKEKEQYEQQGNQQDALQMLNSL